MYGVLINVGSNSGNPNGRGRLFKNHSFEYLPIPESQRTGESVPTYRELGFTHVKEPDIPVHLDPGFETFTYGHVRRGFGDIKSLLGLSKNDLLFFHATLQNGELWSTYIIGYFCRPEVFDCRNLSERMILSFRCKGFGDNAHLKRTNPSVDLLVKGGRGSKLLGKAFPLAKQDNHLTLRESLKNMISTVTGKEIQYNSPWFRWTLICKRPAKLLDMINQHSQLYA